VQGEKGEYLTYLHFNLVAPEDAPDGVPWTETCLACQES